MNREHQNLIERAHVKTSQFVGTIKQFKQLSCVYEV